MPAKNTPPKRTSIGLGAVLLAVFLFLTLTLAPAPADTLALTNVQPSLLTMAAEQPDTAVAVIVRKTTDSTRIEEQVAELGGVVTKQLSLIGGFAARLPAKAIPALAQMPGVYQVALDAPMIQVSDSEDTVIIREDFDAAINSSWPGAWREIGEFDGLDAGDVGVTNFLNGAHQGVRIQNDGKGIQSAIDLSSASSAALSIAYRRKNFTDADTIFVQISTDGGAKWRTLERLTGPATDTDISQSQYDISRYLASSTAIRFLSVKGFTDRARFYLDSVQITYTPQPQPALINPRAAALTLSPGLGSPSTHEANGNSQCGGLLQEAESAALYGNFTVGTDSAASGNQFIYAPQGIGNLMNGPENDNRADFCFHIPAPGAYLIRGWVYAPDVASDSFYVQANGEPAGSFTWYTYTDNYYRDEYTGETSGEPLTVYLPAGDQIVTIYQREDGTRLDKLELVFEDNTYSETVADRFDNDTYYNNDGSDYWLDDWMETGENSEPGMGEITVEADYCPWDGEQCLEFDGDAGTDAAIERGVDLSDAVSATLTFDYRLDSNDATYILEASPNDGRNWVTLRSYSTEERVWDETVDLSAFMTGEARIRFRLVNGDWGVHFRIDDLQITYTTAAGDTHYVRDQFDTVSYSNNRGDVNWRTDWMEAQDNTNPHYDNITVEVENCPDPSSQCIEFDGDGGVGNAIQRGVDLGQALTATLTFDYRVDHDGVTYALDVSPDGGRNWTTLKTYATEALVFGETVDLTPYTGENTQIRFRLAEGFSYHHLYIDNVQIAYTTAALPSTPFQEQDGQVVIEAEHYHQQIVGATGDLWQKTTAFSNFSGDTALQALPNDGTNTGLNTTGPELQYQVAFADPGVYYVHLRGLKPNGSNKDDSVHVGLNGNVVTARGYGFTGFKDYFRWSNYNDGEDVTISIPEPGIYTINVWMREDGVVLDKLWITTDSYPYGSRTEMGPDESQRCMDCIDTANLASPFIQAIGADKLWADDIQGQSITVAVVDSGIANHDDLDFAGIGKSRIIKQHHYTSGTPIVPDDYYGHGTHVAGIIGGNGTDSDGGYMGVAPKVNFIDVKVMDDYGYGSMSDVVEGLEWINDNREKYNIRVVNLSLNSAEADSYNDSPLTAALEILWLNNVVVVVSAGNNGADNNGVLYPPANDPYVITVGSTDTQGTAVINDDAVSVFSAYGTTEEGVTKPDLVAPGRDIIAALASDDANLVIDHPSHAVDGTTYFRMSGTSMSSAVVAGAAALLLSDEPYLTPDQVKQRLMSTARTDWPGYDAQRSGAGYLDVYAAVQNESMEAAVPDTPPHMLLAKMALIAYWASENGGDDIDWENVDWSSVNWGSVNWGSVNWGSVNWGSVNWGSVNWGSVNWGSVNWGSVNWGSVNWGSVNWGSVNWGSVNWGSVNWGSVSWDD